ELAETYTTHSLHAAASLCHRHCLSLLPLTASKTKLPALLRLAILALELSDTALASEAVNQALKIDPNNVAGRVVQALMVLRGGGAAKAVKVLAQLGVAENGEDGGVSSKWVNWVLAMAYRAKGDEEMAKECERRMNGQAVVGSGEGEV
ncbi:hypothetical protein HK104_001313, partial [Borealophlyctis nickersoniae]